MWVRARPCILMLLLGLATTAFSAKCDRKLDGTTTPASPLEGKFWITLATNNRTEIVDQYMPNVKYTGESFNKKEMGKTKKLNFFARSSSEE